MDELSLPLSLEGDDGARKNIPSVNITEELRQSFRDYALSVIISRALPDVRDGLKPVHRRILYAMFQEGLLSNKKFSKSAGVVGEVLKKFHPHGDAPVYEAMVRMAQGWNMRELLVEGQGNFGSVDGDPAAAYRYTEARLTRMAEEMLRDIKEETVDFVPNFDGTTEEPMVLPSRIPNLLINGSEGIAVAMATKCPPHHLGEVIDAILAILREQYEDGPKMDAKALHQIVPGPDFPTGGIICGTQGCLQAIETGRGSIVVRGRANVVENQKSKKAQILIDEIPFQVNKAKLLERIAELVRDKKIDGITDIRDESDRDGLQIAIDLRRDAIGDVVLNQLYEHTSLQSVYSVNMMAIVDGQPKIMSLRSILDEFILFRREVITRRTRFELRQAKQRFHLVAGLLTALDDVDRVITIIRSSESTDEAKARLCAERFVGAIRLSLFAAAPTEQIGQWLKQGYASLDTKQADAILEMRLSRLVGLERNQLVREGEELLQVIQRLEHILGDVRVLVDVMKTELVDIKQRFSSPRRTQITGHAAALTVEDLIPEEEMLVTISLQGYIKRWPLSAYRAQKRGGKGRQAVQAKEEDVIRDAFSASTHAYLLTFTNFGNVYWMKVHELPQTGPQSKGRPIVNLIQLKDKEQVCAILPVRHFPTEEERQFVITCTKRGKVKKTDLTAYSNPRSTGLIACGIEEGDALISVKITDGQSDLLISTKDGMAIRFAENEVRSCGRQAVGVRGIHLREKDAVVSMDVISPDASILTVTEMGYGKRTPIDAYRRQSRAGLGLITMKTDERNGKVADAIQVFENDEVMVVTNQGTLIRMAVRDVSEIGRNTKGVRMISLDKNAGERVISVTRIVDEESEAQGEDLV